MVKMLDNQTEPTTPAVPGAQNGEQLQSSQPPKPRKPSKTKKASKTQSNPADHEPDDAGPSSRRKALLATYEPDKRVESWLKVKKDYNNASNTLDLIPVAAFHGQGRKAKWWSPYLLAVRNAETGSLEAVTKCMSGFTDQFYREMRAKYDADDADNTHVRPDQPSFIEYGGGGGTPDVWFEPNEVWEVAYADITLSPTYEAARGIVSEDRGLSLRFPRFLKVRSDKSLDEATDADELADLFRRQGEKAPGRDVEQDGTSPAEEEGC